MKQRLCKRCGVRFESVKDLICYKCKRLAEKEEQGDHRPALPKAEKKLF